MLTLNILITLYIILIIGVLIVEMYYFNKSYNKIKELLKKQIEVIDRIDDGKV